MNGNDPNDLHILDGKKDVNISNIPKSTILDRYIFLQMILTTGAVFFLVFFLRIKQMLTHFWRTNSSDSYVLCSTYYDDFFWSFITAFDEYSRLPVYTSFFAKDEHTRHTNLFSLQDLLFETIRQLLFRTGS